jgi:hypothetical protein
MTQSNLSPDHRISALLGVTALLWLAAVIVASSSGALATIALPLIAVLVAGTILLPVAIYFASGSLQRYVTRIGLFPLSIMHVWRVPAALVFFWFGLQGQLPPLFWMLAGTGDLIAGLYAAWLIRHPASQRPYWQFHLFGFADFLVAVGTGLFYTLQQDPRMAPIAQLPLSIIPLFGVGISGAAHLIAFDQLRRASNPAALPHRA